MKNIFSGNFVDINISPARVIFKKNCLKELVEILSQMGDSTGVIGTESTLERIDLRTSYILQTPVFFSGETTPNEIDRITDILSEKSVDFIIGMGGGKAIDCAKCVAFDLRKPFVAIPTSSATCASFTSLSVIYDDSKRFLEYRYLNTPPVVTFIDSKILSSSTLNMSSPVKLIMLIEFKIN
jgi:glycerol dehydrogenase